MPRKSGAASTAHLRTPAVLAKAAKSRAKTFAARKRAARQAVAAATVTPPVVKVRKIRKIRRDHLVRGESLVRAPSLHEQEQNRKVALQSAEGRVRFLTARLLSKQVIELLDSIV